jgi:hypothetical protein
LSPVFNFPVCFFQQPLHPSSLSSASLPVGFVHLKIIVSFVHCLYLCSSFQVPEYVSPIPSLCSLAPAVHSLPQAVPNSAARTPLNIPLTVQTSHSSHHPHHSHHPPPLLTYPPSSAQLRLPVVVSAAAGGGVLYPPPYNVATSGVSLSIIQTNVICSSSSDPRPRPIPPVMSHSISSGVIMVPAHTAAAKTSPGRPVLAAAPPSSSSVIGSPPVGGGRTAACGPGCPCAGPLTRSRKRKLCSSSSSSGGGVLAANVNGGYQRLVPKEDSGQFVLDPGRGGGKCQRIGTITIE